MMLVPLELHSLSASPSPSLASTHTSLPPPISDALPPLHTQPSPHASDSSCFWNSLPPLAAATRTCSSHSSSCSTESLTLDQQVFLHDATSEIPCPIENVHSSQHYENQTLEAQTVPSCSYDSSKKAEDLFVYEKKRKKEYFSCRLEEATEDGHMLAAELLYFIKESLYSTVSHNLRVKMSQDWVSILSLSIFEQYLSNDCIHDIPEWVVQPSSFSSVIDQVSQIMIREDHPHHSSVEDLLLTISRFEKAGLVVELKRLGFNEVACLLIGRNVFYGMFATMRALREASNLLRYLRLVMKVPLYSTWSVAFNNDPHKRCLNSIRSVCMFPEKYRYFAWKLDKVELCAKEIRCMTKTRMQNAHTVGAGIRKLLESPIASEFTRIRALSTPDTAVRLIQHYSEIFESLETHGFSET